MAHNSIWLLSLWRREVLRSRTLWSTPVALANEKCTSHNTGITLPSSLINNILLCFNYTACSALIVNTNDFRPELECPSFRCGWERLEEGHQTLAIHNPARVKLRNAWDGSCALGLVEVDYFLRCMFESYSHQLLKLEVG